MEKLNELVEQAKFVADWHGSDWSSALCQGKDGEQTHEIICESRGEAVISTGSNSNEASWLCDYLELCSPANILAIAEAFRALQKQRDALAAENATIKTMNDVLSEELRGYESDSAYDGPIAHKLWHSNSETPVTDAYLNSVRADTLTRIINTGEFSNWVNQGLQVWVNRFNANSDVHLCAGKDGE
ncbi:hypothetical protein [Pantoea agglomerans]|uniref:hypothetical protein n=1 Tax=Enterobacter agglomerans TaxID=549 RepID=UPI003208EF83